MKRREEFGKRCELCKKNREAHMYPFPVRGKYRRLCKVCWHDVSTSNVVNQRAAIDATLD